MAQGEGFGGCYFSCTGKDFFFCWGVPLCLSNLWAIFWNPPLLPSTCMEDPSMYTCKYQPACFYVCHPSDFFEV